MNIIPCNPIADVKEVVPNRSKHEIGLVLQFYEYNVNEAISAFLEDRAASVLNEWNCTSNKPSKKNRKKTEVKNDSVVAKEKAGGENGDLVVPESDVKVPEKDDVRLDNGSSGVERKKTSNVSSQSSDNVSVCSKSIPASKQNSTSNVNNAKQESKMKSLEKPIKELIRHSVSLPRVKILLSEEMDRSEKRLKQSFQELRKILDEREVELSKELNEAKIEANRLLAARMSRAEGLKVGTNRAAVMNDTELKELRVDIKHFISERKFDDDLGRTVRFVRDHERLIKEIKGYGEVVPAKNVYTGRRLSISSTVSSLGQPEPSVASPTTTVAVVSGTATSAVIAVSKSESNVTSSSSSEMSTAEISELHQKLQESLRLQGLSFDTMSSTRINRPNYKQRRPVNSQSPLSYTKSGGGGPNANFASQQQSKDGKPGFRTDDGTFNKPESRSGRRSFGLSRDQNYRAKSRNVGHGQAPSTGGQP